MREQAEKWANFALANLLWSLFLIPVVTIPAATAGVFAMMSRQARGKSAQLYEEFFGTMRRVWAKASLIGLINLIVGGLLLLNMWVFQQMPNLDLVGFLSRSVTLFGGLALVLTNLYVWPLLVVSEMPLRKLIETAYTLMFSHPLRSCAVLIAAGIPIAIGLMLPRGVLLLVSVSACILIINMGTLPIIRQHVPDAMLPYL
jgi:uncharacterized membrane protein YesL